MTPCLSVRGLTKEFRLSKKKMIAAVKEVSFDMFKGETLGLVGESGCGKSTLAHCLMGFEVPTTGEIIIAGKNLSAFKSSELFHFRRTAQMIFQNAYASLNPRMTIEKILAEPNRIHQFCTDSEQRKWIEDLLGLVGLSRQCLKRYPHEFSGGQRQRIVIARALMLKPQLLICDEPLSSLDVSVQAQIVNLLKELLSEFNLTILFISHDRAMVKYMSDRIAVMHQGQIVNFL